MLTHRPEQMMARQALLLSITAAALVFATAAGAQTPASSPVAPAPAVIPLSAIPSTLAGEALRGWFEAFNSGDSTRLVTFLRAYGSEQANEPPMQFRRMTGGFDLISIERSDPRHIEFAVRERNGPTTAIGDIELPAGEPRRMIGPNLQALGPKVLPSAARIDAAERARVVERAAVLLDSFYVFPDVARRMGDSARARLARHEYDGIGSGPAFARRLTDDFTAISHDKHLAVRYSARILPQLPPDNGPPQAPSPDDVARRRAEAAQENCSFEKVERMEGNVGYLKFDGFDDVDYCAETVAAAMTFLSGTRALIIDLRQNGGGSPRMVELISSYLFDSRTHLNDLWTRSTNRTEEFWTRDSVAGRKFGGTKPVYVLTSSRTFSGAEEFSNNLKTLKRATIVGETTGGGAHPVRPRGIDDHFFIGVPFARAINPITKSNWEGTGVAPDVKVPAADALATAVKMIRETPKP
jgi:retinol-binding protein 3